MEDSYVRIADDFPKAPHPRLLLLAYISQFVLYAMTIAYCVVSPSLFSTIALLFMLLSFAVMVGTPYYILKRNESKLSIRVFAYPLERILWLTYAAIFLAEFVFKVIVYATANNDSYSQHKQEFYQIQSALNVFLPLIMLPFIVLSAFIRTQSRELGYFNHSINKLITIPIFLALGILIMLIQIFSISLAGFLFFVCMMVLFFQRKLDFNSYLSWLLVLTIQILCLFFICANFLATTSLISGFQTSDIFRFYGIDALNNFLQFKTSQGYVICLILLFIVSCLMQKIFAYNTIWEIANKVYGGGEIKQSQIFRAEGIQIEQHGHRMSERQPIFKEQEMRAHRKDSRYSLQQFQLPSVQRNQQFTGGMGPGFGENLGRTKTQMYGALGTPLIYPRQRDKEEQIQVRSRRQSKSFSVQKKKKPISKLVVQTFLIGINNIVEFIYSTQFTLRVTEVLSIVVIQRYNNIYSFVAVLWLALVASTQRTRVIYFLTTFILLPVEIGNFIIMYAYNAPQSPIGYLTNLDNYGFQTMELFWLDIIIFNVYLFYMITFILAASRDERHHVHQHPSKAPNPKFWVLLLAFFFRYSYLLTLAAMFFLGFSTVNLLNFVYIVLFLMFFSSGENVLVESKIRNSKEVVTLTTFSRKYWFIIVYYTLICIILKYSYFLFFPDDLMVPLQPTGINLQYNWAFNFSLSSICLSNTTPFFIIFILSQAQIMIYRSTIYLNYSFSLVSQITDIKKPHKNGLRIFFNSAVQVLLQFYYQSLYYISGMIILACSYRWNILSLSIIIVTCLGLMLEFNKFILAFIVFVNLANIVLNYFVLFIKYESVQNFLGEAVINAIKEISLFIGLDLSQQYSLSGVFALNIVIFYFAVQSYALCKIIQEDRFNQDGNLTLSINPDHEDEEEQSVERKSDTISMYEPTVLESQYDDAEFGRNFNKNVIISTKRLYATVLWKKYNWWNKICTVLNLVFTDAITIFVLVCCLQFRLSISMFYFLFIYMLYYLVLFDRIGLLMENDEYYQRISRELQFFKKKQEIICERQHPRSMITGQQSSQSIISFIDETKQKSINMKFQWRSLLWKFSAAVTFLSLVFTYAAQFVVSQFYVQYINGSWTDTLESLLFVLGVSTTKQSTFYRQVYFYYFMIGIAVLEKLLIKYGYTKREEEKVQSKPVNLNKRQYTQLEDPSNFIDQSVDVVESIEVWKPIQDYVLKYEQKELKPNQQQQQESDFAKQCNLLIYFDYKGTLIKNTFLYGTLMMLLRLYLLMMLINLYEKSNIFAFAYLISVLFFWFQPLHFRMVRHINKIAITILLLQYLMLLLDISTETTPLSKPNSQNLSILGMFISSQTWINYLVVDFGKTTTGSSYLVSFLISSIIVFLTQLYFVLFFAISRQSVQMIRKVYDRYEYIGENLQRMPERDTIYLNYENYKNWTYRFMTLSYELLMNNSYIVVSYLILILLANITNYIAFGLVFFACVYIYIGIFTGFSEDKNIYTYTKIFFWIVQVILFLVLAVITVAQIPVFVQTSETVMYIEGLSNLQQIFLLFLIQIWLDLSASAEFKQATQEYDNRVKNRENVMIKCIAYQQNKDLIKRMLKRYKQVMWFQVNLKDALDIIDEWHKAMYKKKIPEFQNLKISKDSSQIQALKRDIKKEQDRRPQEDEQIMQKFQKFMLSKTSVALQNRYYQIMRYIVFNNHRLIDIENCSIDIWDYVLQNYEKLNNQIRQSQAELSTLIKVIQNEEVGDRVDKLEIIKKQEYSQPAGNLNQVVIGIIKAPPKIFIDIKQQKDSFSKIFLFFILSNFSYLLSFFTWAYYMINPCLLSAPFIIYFFSYEIISDHKLTSLMLIYIFSIILLAVWVQVRGITHEDWVKYLFYTDDNGEYVFAIGYLFFIFILIFINEQIKKYQGNKFKHHHEAENRIQGAFRILINEDPNSKMYLWNLKVQDDYQEKECNPMEYFSQKIQYKPEDLTDCPMPSFFESFNEGKTGIDLYPLIASIQIFLTIYLIFFYPFMVQSQNTSLSESFKYFQFSGNMVIAVFTHVVSIVIQRKITLIRPQNQYKSLIKYIYTMILLGLLLIFIYFIAPQNKNIKGVYRPRGFLIAFSFFYFFYFFLSALQIKLGYKKYKSLNSIMTRRRQFNNLIMVCFTAVPFLYELKLMMDYSFCDTSLKIFDWFRLFSIYYSAFKAKMQYYSSTGVVLGNPQPWILKSIGWFGFIGILIIIFGPMYLFSGLNPIAQPNLVTGGALQLGIQIQNGNYFGLYSTSHFSQPPMTYTPQQFYNQNFNQVPQLQFLTSSDIPQQFQLVQFQPYSDTNWAISQPNFIMLTTLMQETIDQLNANQTATHNFSIVVKYALDRRVTETLSSDTNFAYPFNNTFLNATQLESLYYTFTTCNNYTYLPQFYISLIRLFTIGNSYKPRPIEYVNASGVDPYFQGVYLTLLCDGVNSTKETNNVYWSLVSTNTSSPDPDKPTNNGIFLYVLCDKYQNLIGGLGFTALYTSVILVVAGFIRSAFEADLPQIPYFQNPKPDNIIQISEAIGTLRDRKQFRQEYLMYYELIDIIRSPDLMKYLSGSYPLLIEEADEKRRKKEHDKELLNRRDKIQ